MKKLYVKLICTAALLAALPLAACANAEGNKQTTQDDSEIITEQSEENCPDGDCDDGDCDDCPECPDEDKEKCPDGKCDENRKRTIPPRGSFRERGKPHIPPRKPVKPPKDDDIILPDPPVEGVPQN